MNKLIISVFLCLFSVFAYAEVQVELESDQVSIDESFRLVLTQNNPQNTSGIPDLTPLRKDFVIQSTERSTNYSLINGQAQSSTTWTVTLKPQRAGTLTIPALRVGSEQTTPLTVTVTADANIPQSNTAIDNDDKDLMLTTEVSTKQPYVNQQIIYKVTLYNSKQLLDANYQGPKVENALLIQLGPEKRTQIQKNNKLYLMETQTYAIFPQKSGPLTITSPLLNALVYSFEPQRIKAQDKDITLNVQPIPKQFSGKEWLPATNVKLSEHYENIGSNISQGNTLVRTVTLEGVGIPAQLLPNLQFADSDAFNVYPEKGKENNQILQNQLVSSTQIKVTYLFNKAGEISIPELKLPWFNTVTGKEEIASLPAKTITVTPAANTTLPTNTPTQQQTVKSTMPEVTLEGNVPKVAPDTNYWPWLLAALFALAWLLTLILWALQKHRPNSAKSAYKKALNKLHGACNQGNPQAARDALLQWARLHWPDAAVLNLNDLSQLVDDAALRKQIQLLSQALYQKSGQSLWRGDELWRSIPLGKQYSTPAKATIDVLPPLNP